MRLGKEQNGSLLGLYLAGLSAALAAYTAWTIDQGLILDNPAKVLGAYIKSMDSLQGLYEGLAPADRKKARLASYKLICAHAYSLSVYCAA